MERYSGNYFVGNGELFPVSKLNESAFKDGVLLYEVIRVIDRAPLFLDAHLTRFQYSIKNYEEIPAPQNQLITNDIGKLIEANKIKEGNIKLLFCFNDGKLLWQFFFIPFNYPKDEDYRNGVSVGILSVERKTPTIKTVQQDVRGKANEMIKQNNLYEVFLVDSKGCIREGSRSNVFFISGETITTPPTTTVLSGITREKVIGIIKGSGYQLKEEPVLLENIHNYEAIFLTGTSPKVLSVRQVSKQQFNPANKAYLDILSAYNSLIQEDIKQVKLKK